MRSTGRNIYQPIDRFISYDRICMQGENEHMSKTVPTKRKMAKVRTAANGGYQKGEETKERILNAALEEFGDASFLAVTTRRIAEAADVSLPTLQYYFG